MRQQKKMPSFGGVQLQCARQIFEESRRYADLSPLLQPGVPRQAYPGEGCDFLPSKPRESAVLHQKASPRPVEKYVHGGFAES